jgi:hypothetical protein
MGLYKGKVQRVCTGSYILPSADDKRRFSVSRQMVRTKKGKKVIYQEAQAYLILDLGASVINKRREKIIKCESYRHLLQETIYVYIF